ncbi:hypothetical protein JCM11641_004127 [Rhodosporidiobolus odoratus]
MDYVSKLPTRSPTATASPSKLPRRSRSGTIAAPRPAEPVRVNMVVGSAAPRRRTSSLEAVEEHEQEDEHDNGQQDRGRGTPSRQGPTTRELDKRNNSTTETTTSASRTSSPVSEDLRRSDELRRDAYRTLAMRQLERDGRSVAGTQPKKRMKKWLVLVVPPEILPHSPPPLPTTGYANGYGAAGRYSGGILLSLQPTLSAQITLIAREFALPSIAGVDLYLCLPPSQPASALPPPQSEPSGYSFPPSASTIQPICGSKPRLTAEVWQILWSDYFDPKMQVQGMPGVHGLPIAGRIEFDIDPRRARWFPAWSVLPPATVESFQALPPRSPAFETSGRPRFGTSLSYNRSFTPISDAHVSELYTTDEEGEAPPEPEPENEETVHYPVRDRAPSYEDPQMSTPRSGFALGPGSRSGPRPLFLLSQTSSVYRQSPLGSPSFSRSSTPFSPAKLADRPHIPYARRETMPDQELHIELFSQEEREQRAAAKVAASKVVYDDSGFAEGAGEAKLRHGSAGMEGASPLSVHSHEGSIELSSSGSTFFFPRPPTPSHPLDTSVKSQGRDAHERSTEDWTAQLDRLRQASQTSMLEGVEHPSDVGSSFDATASYTDFLRDFVESSPEEIQEELQESGLKYEQDYDSDLYPPRGLYDQAQPHIVVPPSPSPVLPPLSTTDTYKPLQPVSPALSPSVPGYPYNLACIYPSVYLHPHLSPFLLLRLVPSVSIPPRMAFNLSPHLPPVYPVFQLYPPVYPNLNIYPPVPANCSPPSLAMQRSPRPPPMPLRQVEVAYHAVLDSWPVTPQSPERQMSPSLMDRVEDPDSPRFGMGEVDFRQFEKVPGSSSSTPYERASNLIERDWEMATTGMRSLKEASQVSPTDDEEGTPTGKPEEGSEASPTLTEDPFKPSVGSGWVDDEEEEEDEDAEDSLASYGVGRPLSAIVEESENETTSVSILAGPAGGRGFFGVLAAGDSSDETTDGDEEEILRGFGEHGVRERQGGEEAFRIPSISFLPPLVPPKIIYSAATATPSPSSSRCSDSPPRSPGFPGTSPLHSPTITPARHTRQAVGTDYGFEGPAEPRPSSPTPTPPHREPAPSTTQSGHAPDHYTFGVDDTHTTYVEHTGDLEAPYIVSPGLQEALGLDGQPEFRPTRFLNDELDSDGSHSEHGSDGSQYAAYTAADESCQTYDHLSPLPPVGPPESVLFTFPSVEASNDFVDAVAQFVCEAQMQSIERRGKFIVALSGYDPLPQLLSYALIEDERIEFDKWEIFFTEDTVTAHDHPSSSCSAYASFLRLVPIPSHRVHVLKADILDPSREVCPDIVEEIAGDLEEQLAHAFPDVEGPPRFDLILLGIGEDGSCASLLTGHHLLGEDHFLLAPVAGAASSPTARLTFTLPLLCSARRLAFITTGSTKRDALSQMLEARIPFEEKVPAGRVRLAHGQPVIIFADEAAAEGVEYAGTTFWDTEDGSEGMAH